jgi:hypothetical protein
MMNGCEYKSQGRRYKKKVDCDDYEVRKMWSSKYVGNKIVTAECRKDKKMKKSFTSSLGVYFENGNA